MTLERLTAPLLLVAAAFVGIMTAVLGMRPDVPFGAERGFVDAAWAVLAVFWAAGALLAKPAARIQSRRSWLVQMSLLVPAFILLFTTTPSLGPLDRRFTPPSPFPAGAGLALTLAGIALAIWARLHLGRNWSAAVVIKEGHTLVRSGPYAVVRHPIYAGLLLAMLGTAIFDGTERGLVAVGLALIGGLLKSRQEEAFMRERFGEEYGRYAREVKRLIPFVW